VREAAVAGPRRGSSRVPNTTSPEAAISQTTSVSVQAVTSALIATIAQSSWSRPTVFRISRNALWPMIAITEAPIP
jgi:hypothetical protein